MINLLAREKKRAKLKRLYPSLEFCDVSQYEALYELIDLQPLRVRCFEGKGIEVDVPYYSSVELVVGLLGLPCECCGFHPPELRFELTQEKKNFLRIKRK